MRRWAFGAVALAGGLAYLPLENTRTDRIPRNWNQAAAFYDKALNESPRSPAAHLGMGTLLTQLHRPQDAVVHYRIAVEGWPDNADLRLNFAVALAEVGDNQSALDQLDAAAGLRVTDPTAHLLAGSLLLKQSRPGDAWKAYEQALAIQPANLNALMGSGAALTELRRLDEAIEKYRLALTVDSRNAEAHAGLGRTLAASRRLAEAIQELEQALLLDPNDQDARNDLSGRRNYSTESTNDLAVRQGFEPWVQV